MSAERIARLEKALEEIAALAAPYADPRSNITTHCLAARILRVVWALQEETDVGDE